MHASWSMKIFVFVAISRFHIVKNDSSLQPFAIPVNVTFWLSFNVTHTDYITWLFMIPNCHAFLNVFPPKGKPVAKTRPCNDTY